MSDAILRAETFEALKTVLRPFVGKESVSDDDRVLQDLGIAGDDAEELLDAIHKKFGTRFEDLRFSTYFPDDHEANGEGWLRRLGFEDPRRPLTVGHLLDVIMRGAWFDPPDRPAAFVRGSRLRRYVVRGLMAALFPVLFSGSALAFGAWIGEQAGLMRGAGLVLFGLPVAVLLTVMMWRKLPAN